MSSDPPNGAPSPAPEASGAGTPASEAGLAALIRVRGAPLLAALDEYQPGSLDHANGAATYAFAAAAALRMDRPSAELVRETARLHAIGRAYLPVGDLAGGAPQQAEDERAALAGQHEIGARLARGAGVPERVCEWILLSAERYDGTGPGRLQGEMIPLEARIARAACLCDRALAEAQGATPADRRRLAVDRLGLAAGGELDPMVVAALAGTLERAASLG